MFSYLVLRVCMSDLCVMRVCLCVCIMRVCVYHEDVCSCDASKI